eukprot:gene24525-10129_t
MALVVRIRASALVALALLCGAAAQDYSYDYSYDYYDYPPGSSYDYPPIDAPPPRRTSLAITTFFPTTFPQTSLPVTTFFPTTIPQTSLAITTSSSSTIPQTSLSSRHQPLPANSLPSSGFKVGDTINLFGNFDTSCTVFIGNAYCDTTFMSSSQLSVKACTTGQVGVLCDGNIVLRSGSSSTPLLEAVAPTERVRVGNMMSFTGLNFDPSCVIFIGNKFCPTSFFTSKYLLGEVCAPGRVGLRCESTTMWTEVQVQA